MKIIVNNKEYITTQTNVLLFLKEIGFEDLKGSAVAINDKIIPKNILSETNITDEDKITIIRITCGG